jgi:hypothetical protein
MYYLAELWALARSFSDGLSSLQIDVPQSSSQSIPQYTPFCLIHSDTSFDVVFDLGLLIHLICSGVPSRSPIRYDFAGDTARRKKNGRTYGRSTKGRT